MFVKWTGQVIFIEPMNLETIKLFSESSNKYIEKSIKEMIVFFVVSLILYVLDPKLNQLFGSDIL